MRFGFYLPTRGPLAEADALTTLAQHGEALGFSSAVVADHIVVPVSIASKYPYTLSGAFPSEGDALEQLAMVAFLAGKTRTLRLVTSVLIVPHRNPIVTAKALATIDLLSQGRLTVGVGVGWLREEFAALHAPEFARRGAITDEYLRIFKTLWTQSPAHFAGDFYSFQDVWCLPQPVQKPHPPIWIGGHSRAALRRVARFGDGWHPVGANPAAPLLPDELRSKVAELRALTEAAGRDPSSVTISYKAPLYDAALSRETLGPDGAQRRPFSGSAEQIVHDVEVFSGIGVHEVMLDFRSDNLERYLERMDHFADLAGVQAMV